jgi:hypothetical protein
VTLGILLIVFGGVYLCQRNRRGKPKATELGEDGEGIEEDEKPPVSDERAVKYKSDRGGRTRIVKVAGRNEKAATVESGTEDEMGTPPPPFRAVANSDRDGGFRPAPPSQAIGQDPGTGEIQANHPPRSQAQAQAQARYHAQVQAQTRELAVQSQYQGGTQRVQVEKDLPPQPVVPARNPLETELELRQRGEVSPTTILPEQDQESLQQPSEIVNSPSPATQPRTLYPSNPDPPTQNSRARAPSNTRAPSAMRQSSYSKRQSIASVHFAPPTLPPPTDAPPLPAATMRPGTDQRGTFGPGQTAPLNIRKSSAPTIGGIPSYYDPTPRPVGNGRRPSAPSFYDARTGQSLDRPAVRIPTSDDRTGAGGRVATEGEGAKRQPRRPSAAEGVGGESRPHGGRKASADRGGMI